MAKSIPQSIKNVTTSDAMQLILNRTASVTDVITTVADHWHYDLYSRKPGPAYYDRDGNLQMTDLDLACFMSALTDRHAVIDLPTYESRRAPTRREGEHVVSKDHRHGKILSLSANKEVFSFSVRINDMNVMIAGRDGKEDSVGAPRSFMLVDVDGVWYDGWKSISFMPSAKENDFLNDRSLWTGHTVYFKNFVHPNRAMAFYGSHYLLLKTLIARLEEEASYLRTEKKRLIEAGIQFPAAGEGAEIDWPKSTTGPSKPIQVDAFECAIDAPFIEEYDKAPTTQQGLIDTATTVKSYQYTILPKLRFHARATELAFFKAGGLASGFPSWIQGASWETGFREKGKRTDWNRLILHQAHVGQLGFSLRCRTYQKTEQVAVDS